MEPRYEGEEGDVEEMPEAQPSTETEEADNTLAEILSKVNQILQAVTGEQEEQQ